MAGGEGLKLPNWLSYLLVGCTITIIILGILQVVWIRQRIRSLENDGYKKEAQIRSEVTDNAFVANRLQVYGLVVDCEATTVLNNTSLAVFETILPHSTPRTFNITHVCKDGVKSFNVDVNKVGFLVVKLNDGAENLRSDVLSQRVQYVVLENQQFLISYEQGPAQTELYASLKTFGLEQLYHIEDRAIFFLYAMRSTYNKLKDLPPGPDNACSIDMKSFYGVTHLIDDSSKAIDLKTIIGYNSYKEVPLHVLGFKIM